MTFLAKTLLLLPTVVSGLFIVKNPGVATNAPVVTAIASSAEIARPSIIKPLAPMARPSFVPAPATRDQVQTQDQVQDGEQALTLMMARKVRIQRLLGALDHVAEVSMQMSPERSAYLEPVIVDLAEQAVALSEDEAVMRASTSSELDHLEATVERLIKVVSRLVEPELSI